MNFEGLSPGDTVVFDGFGEKEVYEVMSYPYEMYGEVYVDAVHTQTEFYTGECSTLNTDHIQLTD